MGLQSIDDNLWIASQPLRFWGLSVGTRMTIVKLTGDRLAVISPIQLTPELVKEIDLLGEVAYIIAPNRYHHLFAKAFQERYPQAEFLAARGLAEKCPHLKIDRVIEEGEGSLDNRLFYRQFPGMYIPSLQGADPLNEVVFYHPESRSTIVTDTAFYFNAKSSFLTRIIAKLIGSYDRLQVTILEKWLVKDKSEVEAAIRGVLAWDFDRVIMAHGVPIDRGGKSMLKAGYEWLLETTLSEV
jgi:hypothetical protein